MPVRKEDLADIMGGNKPVKHSAGTKAKRSSYSNSGDDLSDIMSGNTSKKKVSSEEPAKTTSPAAVTVEPKSEATASSQSKNELKGSEKSTEPLKEASKTESSKGVSKPAESDSKFSFDNTADRAIAPSEKDLDLVEKRNLNAKAPLALNAESRKSALNEVIAERKVPHKVYTNALDFIKQDLDNQPALLKELSTYPETFKKQVLDGDHSNGIDVKGYLDQRNKQIESQIDATQRNLEVVSANEEGGSGSANQSGRAKMKVYQDKLESLQSYKNSLNQYSKELYKTQLIKSTPLPKDATPEASKNYYKDLGVGISAIDNPSYYDRKSKSSKDGSDKIRNQELVGLEDYRATSEGLQIAKDNLEVQYGLGKVSKEDYDKQSAEIKSHRSKLFEYYPKAREVAEYQALGHILEKYRKVADDADPTMMGSLFHNLIYSGYSDAQVAGAAKELGKSEDEVKEMVNKKDDIPGTSAGANIFNQFAEHGGQEVIEPIRSLLDKRRLRTDAEVENTKYETDKQFQLSANQQVNQPETLIDTDKTIFDTSGNSVANDNYLQEKHNPDAGNHNWGYGDINRLGDAIGGLGKLLVVTEATGSVGDFALGGTIGADVIGVGKGMKAATKFTEAQKSLFGNVVGMTLTNYNENKMQAKEAGMDEEGQQIYSVSRGIGTGIVFGLGFAPQKLISKVLGSGEKEAAKSFAEMIPKEGIKYLEKGKWAEFMKNNLAVRIGVEGMKENVKANATMAIDQAVGFATQSLFAPQSTKNRNLGNELMTEGVKNFITFAPISFFGAAVSTLKNPHDSQTSIEKEAVYRMGLDPSSYKDYVDKQVKEGSMSVQDANKRIQLVNTMGVIHSSGLLPKELSRSEKIEYANNLLHSSNLEAQIKNEGVKLPSDQVELKEKQIEELKKKRADILSKSKGVEVKENGEPVIKPKEEEATGGYLKNKESISNLFENTQGADFQNMFKHLSKDEPILSYEQSMSDNLADIFIKSKADGTNPEFVKAVEDFANKSSAPKEELASEEYKPTINDEPFAEQYFKEGTPEREAYDKLDQEGKDKMIDDKRAELKKNAEAAPPVLSLEQEHAKNAMTKWINSLNGSYIISEEGSEHFLVLTDSQVRKANGLTGGDTAQPHEHTKIELTNEEKKQLNKIEIGKDLGDIDGLEYAKQKRDVLKKVFERAIDELGNSNSKETPTKPEPIQTITPKIEPIKVEGSDPSKDVESTENALKAVIPENKSFSFAISTLPKEGKISYKNIKQSSNALPFDRYLNKPEKLDKEVGSAYKIYEFLKNGGKLPHETILLDKEGKILDGNNRVKAQLALGITDFDYAVKDDKLFSQSNYKTISEAYHADKAAGKETELTKAVESLLGKEQSTEPISSEINISSTPEKEIPSLNKTQTDAKDIIAGTKVFERFSQDEQQGIAAGGEIHAEASVILGGNDGTGKKATATIEEQEGSIELYAKDKGVWIDTPTEHLTEKHGNPIGAGEEAIVWGNPETGTVTKSQNTLQYGDLQEKLDSITLHNSLFPETALKVIGFGRNADGDFQVIVEQPFIKGNETKVTSEQIKAHMEGLGFKNTEDNNYANSQTLIEDLHTGNVILTPEGNMLVIDPVMRLNTPEQGYGGERIASNDINSQSKTTENGNSKSGSEEKSSPSKEESDKESGKEADEGNVNKDGSAENNPAEPPVEPPVEESEGLSGHRGDWIGISKSMLGDKVMEVMGELPTIGNKEVIKKAIGTLYDRARSGGKSVVDAAREYTEEWHDRLFKKDDKGQIKLDSNLKPVINLSQGISPELLGVMGVRQAYLSDMMSKTSDIGEQSRIVLEMNKVDEVLRVAQNQLGRGMQFLQTLFKMGDNGKIIFERNKLSKIIGEEVPVTEEELNKKLDLLRDDKAKADQLKEAYGIIKDLTDKLKTETDKTDNAVEGISREAFDSAIKEAEEKGKKLGEAAKKAGNKSGITKESSLKIASALDKIADFMDKRLSSDLPEGTQGSGISFQKSITDAIREIAKDIREGKLKIPDIIANAIELFGKGEDKEALKARIHEELKNAGIDEKMLYAPTSKQADNDRKNAKEYQKLETERNRQLKRVGELKEKLRTLQGGNLAEPKSNKVNVDTPEIESLKAQVDEAEKSVRSSIAHEKKMKDYQAELDRVTSRIEKEKPAVKKEISAEEKEIRSKIETERKNWDDEKSKKIRVDNLNKEIERVKGRLEKETNPATKKELAEDEKKLIEQLKSEKSVWAHEKKMDSLQEELDRLTSRIKKEQSDAPVKEMDAEEKGIREKMKAERDKWSAENSKEVRIDKLNKEIERVKNRQEKESNPAIKKELDADEKQLNEQLNTEKSEWAQEKKMDALEAELDRIKDRKEREPVEKTKREISSEEQAKRDEIEQEQNNWDKEKRIERLNTELQRVKDRIEKATPAQKAELSQTEKDLAKRIKEENAVWATENQYNTVGKLADIEAMAKKTNETNITKEMVEKGLINKLVDAHFGKGMDSGEILDAAYAELKKILPDATRNGMRDAYAKLGDFEPETRAKVEDDIKKQAREVREIAKLERETELLARGEEIVNDKSKKNEVSNEVLKKLKEEKALLLQQAKNAEVNQQVEDINNHIKTWEKILKSADKTGGVIEQMKAENKKKIEDALLNQGIKIDSSSSDIVQKRRDIANTHNSKVDEILSNPNLSPETIKTLEGIKIKNINDAEDLGERIDKKSRELQGEINKTDRSNPESRRVRDELIKLQEGLTKSLKSTDQQVKLQSAKQKLIGDTNKMKRDIAGGRFSTSREPAQLKIDREYIKLSIERNRVRAEYDKKEENLIYKSKTKLGKGGDMLFRFRRGSLVSSLFSTATKLPLSAIFKIGSDMVTNNITSMLLPHWIGKLTGLNKSTERGRISWKADIAGLKETTGFGLSHIKIDEALLKKTKGEVLDAGKKLQEQKKAILKEPKSEARFAKEKEITARIKVNDNIIHNLKLDSLLKSTDAVKEVTAKRLFDVMDIAEKLKADKDQKPFEQFMNNEYKQAKEAYDEAEFNSSVAFVQQFTGKPWSNRMEQVREGAHSFEESMGDFKRMSYRDRMDLHSSKFGRGAETAIYAVDTIGRIHAATKDVSAMKQFMEGYAKRIQKAIESRDAGNPLPESEKYVIMQKSFEIDFKGGKYSEKNGMVRVIQDLSKNIDRAIAERASKEGRASVGDKVKDGLGTAVKNILLPVLKIPANIGNSAIFKFTLGFPLAVGRIAGEIGRVAKGMDTSTKAAFLEDASHFGEAFKKHMETLEPEFADKIVEGLNKGFVGSSIFMVAAHMVSAGALAWGGVWTPGAHKKKDKYGNDMPFGSFSVNGHIYSNYFTKVLGHLPEFMPVIMACSYTQAIDRQEKSNATHERKGQDEKVESPFKAGLISMMSTAIEESPIKGLTSFGSEAAIKTVADDALSSFYSVSLLRDIGIVAAELDGQERDVKTMRDRALVNYGLKYFVEKKQQALTIGGAGASGGY